MSPISRCPLLVAISLAGARVRITGEIAKARCKTQIDIGFGDAVTPGSVHAVYPVLIEDLPAPRLRTYLVYTVIWAKNTFTLGRADYQRQYEPILYGWPEGAQRHWCGVVNHDTSMNALFKQEAKPRLASCSSFLLNLPGTPGRGRRR